MEGSGELSSPALLLRLREHAPKVGMRVRRCLRRRGPWGRCRRHGEAVEGMVDEEVVDAHAFVAVPGAAEAPPGELAVRWLDGAVGVVEAQIEEGAQSVALGRVVADRAIAFGRVVDVDGVGCDVVVAADDQQGVALEVRGVGAQQAIQEVELVGEIVRAHGGAVRHVDRGDADAALHGPFDVARLASSSSPGRPRVTSSIGDLARMATPLWPGSPTTARL